MIWNDMTPRGMSILFETLKNLDVFEITTLRLNGNKIKDEGLISMCDWLAIKPSLRFLDLSHTNLTNKSIEMLSESLVGNTSLRKLSMDGNINISDKAAPYLLNIAQTTCITNLEIARSLLSFNISTEIQNEFGKPFQERDVPINSKSKSAAKISS